MIEKILKIFEKVKYFDVSKGFAVNSFMIRKGRYIFETTWDPWDGNNHQYQLIIYEKQVAEPLKRFIYIENGKGDEKIKKGYKILHKKWLDKEDTEREKDKEKKDNLRKLEKLS